MRFPTPYQRIVKAAKRGTGCRLTYEDCQELGVMDDAVTTRAQLDDEEWAEIKRENRRIARQRRSER